MPAPSLTSGDINMPSPGALLEIQTTHTHHLLKKYRTYAIIVRMSINDLLLMMAAYEEAQGSPDPSTQNGALILNASGLVIARGHNTFPKGVRVTPERLERPLKYSYIEHAERNAILHAARIGAATERATMICPWFACADCGRAIIGAGIERVIGHKRMFDETPERWKNSIDDAWTMFHESGVETVLIDGTLPEAPPIRFNGVMWQP
jgi:dCMP deaminase